MVYAVYRCLYGEDFIQQSIKSIDPFVDKIFIFWDDKPWADVTQCVYKGEVVKFPQKFDNILDKIKELNNPKIELIYDHVYNNINQFTHFVNDIILPDYKKPKEIMIVEVDHVFRKDQIEQSFKEFRGRKLINASTRQVEIWKHFNFRIPERKYRTGVVFWNLENSNKFPKTKRQAEAPGMERLNSFVHNFGFAVSEKAMYWKHLTAIGFSQGIGDTVPNENWYENKWLNWNFETNNKNLEISKGKEHLIPKAIKYNIEELPELMKGV